MSEEISTQSWGSRLKNALMGILVGIAMIIGSSMLIFWNERHTLHTAQSLEQAGKVVISVPSSPINPENNLKVIYLSDQATTKEILTDSILNISVNAINLHRKVVMYQWEEHVQTRTESQVGGSERTVKRYTYTKEWSPKRIDSSSFHDVQGHENPSQLLIPSQLQYAKKVTVGDFVLPQSLVTQISQSQPINLNQVDKDALITEYKKNVTLKENELYFGQDPQNPQLGDIRLSMTAAYPQEVSIIAQQIDKTLQPYAAPAGESVLLLESGQVSAPSMIEHALSQNQLMGWMFRIASLVLLVLGFSLLFKPLVVLADVLPFLGTIVGFGTGFVACLCGVSLWIILTAIAWFATRPYLSISLIVLLIAGSYLLIQVKRRKIEAKPAEIKTV